MGGQRADIPAAGSPRMNSLISTRRRVLAINAELARGSTYAILRHAGPVLGITIPDVRITRARGAHGELCVRSLNTGAWITTTTTDRIEITDAAGRVYATYQGGHCRSEEHTSEL